jgi:cytochrome P450
MKKYFSNPDRFPICRSSQYHRSFDYGIHQCIAMHLVRAQLKALSNRIIQQLPKLQLAQSRDDVQFINDSDKDIVLNKCL